MSSALRACARSLGFLMGYFSLSKINNLFYFASFSIGKLFFLILFILCHLSHLRCSSFSLKAPALYSKVISKSHGSTWPLAAFLYLSARHQITLRDHRRGVPVYFPVEAGSHFTDPGRMDGWVDLFFIPISLSNKTKIITHEHRMTIKNKTTNDTK